MTLTILRTAAVAVLCSLFAATTLADTYPSKPIRFIVPYPPGGIGDTFSRALAEPLAARLGQPVLVENKPGASQIIGVEATARSAPDGYTIMLSSMSNLAINPATIAKLPYDPQKDLAPVSIAFYTPLFLVVHPQVKATSVSELVALARQTPGKLTFASIGNGSSVHLAGEMFKQLAGIDLFHIPYKGSAPAISDLVGGRVDMMFDGGTSALPQVKAGKLRVLAVTAPKRASFWPEVPTMEEAGVKGYDLTVWFSISATGGTPQPILERLSSEVRQVLANPALQDRFKQYGMDLAGSTPGELAALIRAETGKWARVVKTAGLKPE